jgi:hypothetical protein
MTDQTHICSVQYDFSQIVLHPQWYIRLLPAIQTFILDYHNKLHKFKHTKELELFRQERIKFITLVSENLQYIKQNFTAEQEYIFDTERKPIDTIVIHHSSLPPTMDLRYLETIHLLNLYVRDFINRESQYYGRSIFSGHVDKKMQTFFAYHYIIFTDGTYRQTLKDKYIGWHCGDWDYNCSSIAICFHDDLENKLPTQKALHTAYKIIRKYNVKNILGHREIKPSTTCPGNKFLGPDGWKQYLL